MKKILLVDDEEFIHSVLTPILKNSFECEIVSQFDTSSALAYVQTNPVDLIILDINMPDSNSLFFVSTVKDNKATKDIPVVMLSSMSFEEIKKAFLERGVTHFFNKTAILDQEEKKEFLNTLRTILN